MSAKYRPISDIRRVIGVIRERLDDARHYEDKRRSFHDKFGPEADAMHNYQSDVDSIYDDIFNILRSMILFPSHHIRHFPLLDSFYENASFDKSVFVMTKFPDERDARKDSGLNRVIDVVLDSLKTNSYTGRLARGNAQYHDNLWDNVELHLLGCSRGIAIIEDKSKGELNPNVAMEWGFLKAFGRPVLYLEESEFKHQRADWHGLIKYRFRWDEPDDDINNAIAEWLSSARGAQKI